MNPMLVKCGNLLRMSLTRREFILCSAGFVLQVDCPDLAMGRHIQYAHLGLDEFRKMARLHGVFVDKDGAVYIGDSEAHRVRMLRP